jgi:hypothetical protein
MKLPWYLRQTANVTLVANLGGLFTVVHLGGAQPWAASDAPELTWAALASSADGLRLMAGVNAGSYFGLPVAPIYISTNAGVTWTKTTAPSNNWSGVACSADGLKLVAVSSPLLSHFADGFIYTSPDGGASWSRANAPSNNWTSVASSADGKKLFASAVPVSQWDTNGTETWLGEGALYISLDMGTTWVRSSAPSNNWTAVASSADGTRLVALAGLKSVSSGGYEGPGGIYCSSDSGKTWIQTSSVSTNWSCVASSADGTKLVAAVGGGVYQGAGLIYISTNSGTTWSATAAPSEDWMSVASSTDGTKLVAVADNVYISSDSGLTWVPSGPTSSRWQAVACSADGFRAVAGGHFTSLYTLPYTGPWRSAEGPPNGGGCGACSADATKLVAITCRGGTICTSTNSGANWTSTSVRNDRWSGVASSADGAKLVAVGWIEDDPPGGDGLIYTSTNSGASWAPTAAPSNRWTSVATSADGVMLVAVAYLAQGGNGRIYTSTNSGATWAPTSAPTNWWLSVASSADGSKLVAVSGESFGGDGLIYTSGDSGQSWAQTSAPTNYWQSVASSADGTKLVAGALGGAGDGRIYTSSNSGATWMPTTAPISSWVVASSADGSTLAAAADGSSLAAPADAAESVYVSRDFGASWVQAGAPAGAGGPVLCSADGSTIIVSGSGKVFTLRAPPPTRPVPLSPRLVIARSGANLALAWLVPSSRFVLQQNPDLGPLNWVDVPDPPALDCTNLHYRMTLTPSLSRACYRLKQQ